MRMRVVMALFCFATGLAVGAEDSGKEKTPAYYRAPRLHNAEFAAFLADLQTSLEKAEDVLVFEGLPHPRTERDLFERERGEKRVTVLHDADFYAGPHRPTEKQSAWLVRLVVGSLSENHGAKFCGGFHADYAVTWRADGEPWAALFCHGCGEAAVFSPRGSLMADLGGRESAARRQWLRQFDKRRPR